MRFIRWLGAGVKGHDSWAWFDLLIVPMILAVGIIGFTLLEGKRDRDAEAGRFDVDQAVQEDRARGSALWGYLDGMTALLLGRFPPLSIREGQRWRGFG